MRMSKELDIRRSANILKELLDKYVNNGCEDIEVGILVEANYESWKKYYLRILDWNHPLYNFLYSPPHYIGSDMHLTTLDEAQSYKECLRSYLLSLLEKEIGISSVGMKARVINRKFKLCDLDLFDIVALVEGRDDDMPNGYSFLYLCRPNNQESNKMEDIIKYDEESRKFELVSK